MIFQLAKDIIKKTLPVKVKDNLISIVLSIKIKQIQLNHLKELKRVKKKEKIKVAFFLIIDSIWKYEGVYRLMDKDIQFDPIIVVCPYIVYGEETMLKEMNKAYDTFINNGYNVIKSLNEKTGSWLDVKKEIKPDIVCFTNQWNVTKPEYQIQNYLGKLSCYVPYAFKNSFLYHHHFNGPMQNFVWKFFLETEIHKKLSIQYSKIKGKNTVVSGYPGMDKLIFTDHQPKDVWKIKDKKVKRIIWAPHHTIPGMGATLDFSTFLKYADFMFELTERFRDHIQIAFKPHPLLRSKLSSEEVWGKEKTDAYYKKWAERPNGHLFEGEYIDLFLTSDGMLHDCGSFLVEYICTNQPVMYLMNDNTITDRLNEVGKMALATLYHGRSEEDIYQFINEVIIGGNDPKRNDRMLFLNSVVKPPNNITASENIFNHLKSVLNSEVH